MEKVKIQAQSSWGLPWEKEFSTIFTCQPDFRKRRNAQSCELNVENQSLPPTNHASSHLVMPVSNHYFDYARTLSGGTCTAIVATDRTFYRGAVVNEVGIPPQEEIASVEKLIHLALPVRLTHMAKGERSGVEMACTYDIHPKVARLLSFRDVRIGDLITVERGRNKSVCQVIWTGDPNSALRGQFTVECVEGNRSPWEEELRQMQEQYLPIAPDEAKKKTAMNNFRKGDQNRRRSPRFQIQGGADLSDVSGKGRFEGRLEQISEFGCLISANDLLVPGSDIRLALNIYDVSVALKGNVRYTAENRAMGVQFQAIRQGDRPLLDYVLNRVKKRRKEDFSDLEVVTSPLVAAAG